MLYLQSIIHINDMITNYSLTLSNVYNMSTAPDFYKEIQLLDVLTQTLAYPFDTREITAMFQDGRHSPRRW